jgi:hypothetical protein
MEINSHQPKQKIKRRRRKKTMTIGGESDEPELFSL